MMTESVLSHRRTMPRFGGYIVDPRHVPLPARAAYLAEWGEWFRANPLYREPWMLDLISEMKHRKGAK